MGPKLPSTCARPANYGALGCFSSKTSLFACFWLAWVGKPRFFTHQMPSHIGGPQTAVELRSTRKLRCFGLPLLQNFAIYRLLVGLGRKTSVFCTPDALSYWWATNCCRYGSKPLQHDNIQIAIVLITPAVVYSLLVWSRCSDVRTNKSIKHCHGKSQSLYSLARDIDRFTERIQ